MSEISGHYTSEFPKDSGFYWTFDEEYPVPQVTFLHHDGTRGWCLYASGGYAHGVRWLKGRTYRSTEPLVAPPAFLDVVITKALFRDWMRKAP